MVERSPSGLYTSVMSVLCYCGKTLFAENREKLVELQFSVKAFTTKRILGFKWLKKWKRNCMRVKYICFCRQIFGGLDMKEFENHFRTQSTSSNVTKTSFWVLSTVWRQYGHWNKRHLLWMTGNTERDYNNLP